MFVKKTRLDDLLSEMDVRAKQETREALDHALQNCARDLINNAYQTARDKDRKTIYPEDVESTVVEQASETYRGDEEYDYVAMVKNRMYLTDSLSSLIDYLEGLK